MLYLLAKRFVAGENALEVLDRAKGLRAQGLLGTIDHLGEHVRDTEQARSVAKEYGDLLGQMDQIGLDAHLSVKPTHLGLDISAEEAYQNILSLARAAGRGGHFVRLDMEGSPYTESTLALCKKLRKEFPDRVGVVIQAYLYRSHEDIEDCVMDKTRVRLCKGAYKEPVSIAFRSKEDVNANYDKLSEMLIKHGSYPAFATHDEMRIRNIITYARIHGKAPQDFEFQMLLGVRTQLAHELVKSGYNVRIYLPYGKDWFSYFYRRIRERKENLYFVLRNLFN